MKPIHFLAGILMMYNFGEMNRKGGFGNDENTIKASCFKKHFLLVEVSLEI